VGLHVVASDGPDQLDVHSNDIDGAGTTGGSCTSTGIALDEGTVAPTAPEGIFRNNIVRGGECATAIVVGERQPSCDPAVFENNDLDPYNSPSALYVDEVSSPLTTIAAVNGLIDGTFAANISMDAAFVTYPTDLHLTAGSPCVGAGTAAGAPLVDFEGDPRDPATPDIGADEL
jgi:hypothetical protein